MVGIDAVRRVGLRFGREGSSVFSMMKPEIDPKLLNDPRFCRVLEDALAIQDRFSAEPVYARTGKGSLKSEGVAELRKLKEKSKSAEEK